MAKSIVFLDQSTAKVGYAIFKKNKLVDYGILTLTKANKGTDNNAHAERRQYLITQLKDFINKHDIDTVVYEGIWQSNTSKNNVDTFKKLAKVQASIEDFSFKDKLKFVEFSVNEWRSYLPLGLKGKGHPTREAIKKAVVAYIDKQYPKLIDEKEDTKEAIAMGLAWIKREESMIGEEEW